MQCPIKSCANASEISKGLKWHKIQSHPKIKELWVDACVRGDISKWIKVCSAHLLHETDFPEQKTSDRLKCNAVPNTGKILISIHF